MKKTTTLLATLPQWAQEHLANIKQQRDDASWRADEAERRERSTALELQRSHRRIAELESRTGRLRTITTEGMK